MNSRAYIDRLFEEGTYYHGTHGDFRSFRKGRAGLVFVTTSPEYAAQYGRVKKAILRCKNIADLDNDPKARQLAIDTFNGSNFREDDASPVFEPENDETWELAESPDFLDAMQAAGYDGAKFQEDSGITYAIFNPKDVGLEPVAESEEDAFENPIPGRFHYYCNCVGWPREDVSREGGLCDMIDQRISISRSTFLRHVDPREMRQMERNFGYDPRTLTMARDFAVRYYRSKLHGRTVYYFDHSAIEYVFTSDGRPSQSQA